MASEEYYRANSQILDLLGSQATRQRNQIKEQSDDMANTTREVGYNYANAIPGTLKAYQDAKKSDQEYRRYEQDQNRVNQQMDLEQKRFGTESEEANQRIAVNRQNMENANRKNTYMQQPEKAGGPTREQSGWQLEAEEARLRPQALRAQIAQAGQAQNQEKIANAAILLEKAVAANDPQQIQQAQIQAQAMGLTAQQVQVAQRMAEKNLASGVSSQRILYENSVEGATTTNALQEVNQDLQALAQLESASKAFKSEFWRGTETAKLAQDDAIAAARQLKVRTDDIESSTTIDKEGSIRNVLNAARSNVKTKLDQIERTAGANPPAQVRALIAQYKLALQNAGKSLDAKTNIFDGGQAPGAQSALVNALKGQGQPQSQGPVFGAQQGPGQVIPTQGQPQQPGMQQQPVGPSPYRQYQRR